MVDRSETPQQESLTGLPPLPSIEYFQRDYATGFVRPSRRVMTGLGFCLVLAGLLGIFFFSAQDKDNIASAETTTTERSSRVDPASPISVNPEVAFGDSQSSTTISSNGLELAADSEDDEETVRPFSANRAACTSLYANPTADVAFRFQQDVPTSPSSSTTQDQTTSTAPSTEASTTAASTTATPTTATPTTATPTTAAPTTAAPTTAAAPVTAPPAPPGWADAGHGVNVPIVLLAIRCCESRNNYVAQNSVSTASGAYQFVDGTWAGQFGVSKARFATPAQQDTAAVRLWEARGTQPWDASSNCWELDEA